MNNQIQVGSRVRSHVHVSGEWFPSHLGIVVQISNDGSICQVDRMSLHGGAPWLVWEADSHLTLESELT